MAIAVEPSTRFVVGGLVVDVEAREVELDGERVTLTRREFDLLALMAASPRRVFRRSSLYEHIYGVDLSTSSRVIDAHAMRLRRRLGGRYVTSFRSIGYRLLREVDL